MAIFKDNSKNLLIDHVHTYYMYLLSKLDNKINISYSSHILTKESVDRLNELESCFKYSYSKKKLADLHEKLLGRANKNTLMEVKWYGF